jgi:heterodisulfide reductase subunit D
MKSHSVEEMVQETQTYYCLDCGVCTGSCPVARVHPEFSPRLIVEKSLIGLEEISDQEIWSCLTCARCSVRCPANIDFPEFVRLIRDEATQLGFDGEYAHNGMLQTLNSLQTRPLKQHRLAWLTPAEKTAPQGDVYYFVGCRPFYDVIFRDIEAGSIQGARNAVRLINALGIVPALSADECCCGHDALWNGREDRLKLLAEKNIAAIRATGAKQVVFSCPEGYLTFRDYYPKFFGDLGFEALSLDEFLVKTIPDRGLTLKPLEQTVTYHDPCRLGRMAGIYDAPRDLLRLIPELKLVEMERSRENGVCCGTSGWMNCTACSKAIQTERLREALGTGAGTLVTACPKCEIHLRCALKANPMEIQIKDLHDLLAEQIA